MDSFELNKIMGAVLFTCLVVLSLNITAGAVFTPGKLAKPGYEIAVPEVPAAGAESAAKEPDQPIATLLASADPKRGETAAKLCATCHTFEKGGANKVGPNLYGVVNEKKGEGRGGFNFSAALKAKGGTWTFDDLNQFLAAPRAYVPGTSMSFAGLTRSGQRADLIAYLNAQSDSPQALPKAAEAPAAAPAAEAPAAEAPAAAAPAAGGDAPAKPQ